MTILNNQKPFAPPNPFASSKPLVSPAATPSGVITSVKTDVEKVAELSGEIHPQAVAKPIDIKELPKLAEQLGWMASFNKNSIEIKKPGESITRNYSKVYKQGNYLIGENDLGLFGDNPGLPRTFDVLDKKGCVSHAFILPT